MDTRRLAAGRHRRHRQIRGRERQHEAASARCDTDRLRLHLRLALMAFTDTGLVARPERLPRARAAPRRARARVSGRPRRQPGAARGDRCDRRVLRHVQREHARQLPAVAGGRPAHASRRARPWPRSWVRRPRTCISFGQNMTTLNFALSAAIGRTLAARATKCSSPSSITRRIAARGSRCKSAASSCRKCACEESGVLDTEDMAAKISRRTKVFALGASSNALGTVNDLALARRLTREVGALLVIDAVHYAPHFPVDVRALDADFLLCSAYKFYGPHVGILYSKPGALERLPTSRLSVQDPAAPYRIETGTLNHAAIEGVRAAIEYLASWGTGATLARAHRRCHDRHLRLRARPRAHLSRGRTAHPRRQVWGPDFGSRARAPTVSITLERHARGGGGDGARRARHLRLGRQLLRGPRRGSARPRRARRACCARASPCTRARRRSRRLLDALERLG